MVSQLCSRDPVGPGWDIGQISGGFLRGYEALEQGQHHCLVLCVTEKTLLLRIAQPTDAGPMAQSGR